MSASLNFVNLPNDYSIDESKLQTILNNEHDHLNESEIEILKKSIIEFIDKLQKIGVIESEDDRTVFYICDYLLEDYKHDPTFYISGWNDIIVNTTKITRRG